MDISRIGQSGGVDYISAFTNNRNDVSKTTFSNSFTDTVSISSEAMEKHLAMKNSTNQQKQTSDVAAQIAAWYDNFRENMGTVEEPDYSTWSPENLERRQKLIEERDAMIPYSSNETFTETNRQLNGILDQLMVLDAVGGQQVLSDKDMKAALDSLHSAMDKWEGALPGTAAWAAGEGGNMQPSLASSSLSQTYFMNRFPERKEEDLLFDKDESSKNEESDSSTQPSSEAIGEYKESTSVPIMIDKEL